MTRNATNQLLQKAKKSKSDEFYTQLCDIERELQYYPDSFVGKIVYCNCDDPRISNFFRFFAIHFHELGLKKIIASCYREQVNDLFFSQESEKGFWGAVAATLGVVLPSFIENSPNSLGEAMLLGVPVVASKTGGIPSLVEDGKEVLLTEPGDSAMLAERVLDIFDDGMFAELLGENAAARAALTHDRMANYKMLTWIYEEIAKENG